MPTYNINASVDINFELECEECGNSLEWRECKDRPYTYYKITPCESCYGGAVDRAHCAGQEDGYEMGFSAGLDAGKESAS